jgi:Bacterial membrane protein YfhO
MRRAVIPLLIVGCLGALTVACFGRALFRGEQFAYRDAAHFYYPLYQRVQTEWNAGRLPLWEPEENGGMPLMGNPTAAVLYPGKVLFAVLPYAWGARLYVVTHVLLAAAAMLALLRHWGVSWTGSALGALAYAFGGPILFQYCNIIYLVGAAWVPFGFRAVDRWLRLGRRFALLELAVVLAMETLGGEPESAFLTGLAAVAYAIALAWGRRRRPADRGETAFRGSSRLVVPVLIVVLAAWVGVTLGMAHLAPAVRTHTVPPVALPWMSWVGPTVVAAWVVLGLVLLARWRRGWPGSGRVLVPMLGGLFAAAVLAGAIAAAQLLPVLEFTGQTVRAAEEGPHEIYTFSLSPLRVVEFFWPNPFGTPFQGNRSWLSVLPPSEKAVKVWVPTLYLGGPTVVFALAAARWRGRGAPWRAWMTAVALLSLLAAFGEFTSPLLWARFVPGWSALLGPHDPVDCLPIRFDDHLRDGDGSLYWLMATLLPGFRQFRFPSKLLTFTVLGLAALSGFGWDDLTTRQQGARQRAAAWASGLLTLTVAALLSSLICRSSVVDWLGRQVVVSAFGPLDAAGAFHAMVIGLLHGAAVLTAVLVVALQGGRRPGLAAVAALAILTLDLAVANARYVLTLPQSLLEGTPEVLRLIQAEEARRPMHGPYRIHRTPSWSPHSWIKTASIDRVRDFVVWERGTLQPKYGITEGVHYTTTLGVAELFDYEFYFGGFPRSADAVIAQALHVDVGSKVIYYPRRAFDMWNTRYFVLPYFPHWSDEYRGIAAFIDQSERVYPPRDEFTGPGGHEREAEWIGNHDYQVRRNLNEFPRAWVVHSGRFLPSITGLGRENRKNPMEEILFANDPIWKNPARTVYDPRTLAWLESDDRGTLAPFLRGAVTGAEEAVTVVRHDPDCVELDARLATPGLVVLADVYYPGWTLTIDGKAAPVYRANRMMRGAAVEAGRHRLVYSFRPRSFRVGLVVSGCGLALLAALAVWFAFCPVTPVLTPERATEPGDRPDEPGPPSRGAP